MDQFEKVKKLKEKANVTYEEAKAVLEACNWDMLDAIVYLEKLGKVNEPKSANYSTHYEEPKHFEEASSQYNENKSSFKSTIKQFFKWCGKVIKKGNEHYFDVDRKGENFLSIPLTIMIILTIIFFWAIIILLIIGLFLGCRYHFRGPDLKTDNLNNAMDKASQVAEDIKKDFKGN